MRDLVPLEPLDYLAVGHVSVDLTPSGKRLGGTVSYAARTAQALGLRAGIVTSMGADVPVDDLGGIQISSIPAPQSTRFENLPAAAGRRQVLHSRAERITLDHIPPAWRRTPIIHLAPIAQELDAGLGADLPTALLGITPQGWMRAWDEEGRVHACAWENSGPALRHAGAVVLSLDDLQRDLEQAELMAHQTRILCVTEGRAGAVLHWNGDRRRFRAPAFEEVDSTGAGDIFAAAFFIRLHATRDPWEAARFATRLAAHSVTRSGLDGIPTSREIQESLTEVFL